jgi:hypothetical protein
LPIEATMTTISHATTATVHTLAGTVETVHASAFEPEQLVTVYGLTEGGAVRSAKVEAGALARRELGGARRALGCDTVYFQAGGAWCACTSSGAEENGDRCVPYDVAEAARVAADKTVKVEGSDGAIASVTVGEALERGWLTAEEAAARRSPPNLFAEIFADWVIVAAPVGHLPGAMSAAERARRLAAEEALVEEADGAELRSAADR